MTSEYVGRSVLAFTVLNWGCLCIHPPLQTGAEGTHPVPQLAGLWDTHQHSKKREKRGILYLCSHVRENKKGVFFQ